MVVIEAMVGFCSDLGIKKFLDPMMFSFSFELLALVFLEELSV